MKLSEAIRMGSLLVKEPQAADIRACAITMANLSTNGFMSQTSDDTLAYAAFKDTFGWIDGFKAPCPMECCSLRLANEGVEIIWHLFDVHVMALKDMTIEQLADYVATIEPKEEPETEAPDVHLRDMQEVKSA